MAFTENIIAGFRRLTARVNGVALRQKADARRLIDLERRVFGVLGDPNALPAAPGSPVLNIGELFVARITGFAGAGQYTAVRRVPNPAAAWAMQNDSDDADTIIVRTLPLFGDGDQTKHFGVLPTGLHVLTQWAGQATDGTQIYYVVSLAQLSWLGIVQSCNKGLASSTGLCTVRPATGSINAPTAAPGASDIVCQIGKEAWGRANDPCYVLWVGGTPPWLAVVPALGEDTYPFPSNLDGNQAAPVPQSMCSASITP